MIQQKDPIPRAVITRATLWRAIAASVIGNVLEWFDFAVYGYMVPFIGPHFFPSHDPVATNLATFTVFAIWQWCVSSARGRPTGIRRFDPGLGSGCHQAASVQ